MSSEKNTEATVETIPEPSKLQVFFAKYKLPIIATGVGLFTGAIGFAGGYAFAQSRMADVEYGCCADCVCDAFLEAATDAVEVTEI